MYIVSINGDTSFIDHQFTDTMSQRQFVRRRDMELSSPGFQRESATPQAIGDEIQFSRSNSQRQELQPPSGGGGGGEGFQGELLNSAALAAFLKRRLSLLDILRETLYLARARRKYVLVFLSIFILGMLLIHGFSQYLVFQALQNDLDHAPEARQVCLLDILHAWKEAARKETVRPAQQEGFYALFQEKCTKFFKLPAEDAGFYTFRSGTMAYKSRVGFTRTRTSHWYGRFAFWLLAWTVWGQVALTWGLHFASMRTMAYRPPSMRTKGSPSQTLTEVFRELFALKVLQGVIRVTLTERCFFIMFVITRTVVVVRALVKRDKSLDLVAVPDVKSLVSLWLELADPIPFLFLLSTAGAALEPGVWGFKALGRGFEMAKGNRLKNYLICSLLVLWNWLSDGLTDLVDFKHHPFWRSMLQGNFAAMRTIPRFFVVPVFYFLCTSLRERLDTTG